MDTGPCENTHLPHPPSIQTVFLLQQFFSVEWHFISSLSPPCPCFLCLASWKHKNFLAEEIQVPPNWGLAPDQSSCWYPRNLEVVGGKLWWIGFTNFYNRATPTMAYSSVTSLNVELWSGIHNWLGDSVGSNLILNTCYTTEKKDMLVSTRGKKSDWTAAKEDGFAFSAQLQTDRSFSQGTERKKISKGKKK